MITQLLLAAALAAPAPALAAEAAREPLISTVAVAAANGRFSALCARGPLSVDALLSDPSFRADLEYGSGEEVSELRDYAACRELQGGPRGCATLDGLAGAFAGRAADCRTLAAEDRFVFQTLRGGDAVGACRKLMELDGKRGPAVDADCALIVKGVRAGGTLTCERFAGRRVIAVEEPCDEFLIMWSGDVKACDRYKRADLRRECRARTALAAGLRAPAACASSSSCQALAAKSPGACDGLRARFGRALCARVAGDLAAEQKRVAREAELRRQAELEFKAKAAKAAEAQAAAAAALRAKAEAALARSRAEQLAAEEKVRKNAEVQAAKKAAVEAAVKAKAEAEARKAAEAKAKVERADKPQFRKGEPMQKEPPEVREMMKAIEEGRPLPKPKPKPRKAVPPDETPSGE